MFKTDILFSGYYGQKNTGDDAFVEVASWGADQYWSLKDVRFLSKSEDLPLTKKGSKGFPLSLPRTYGIQQKFLINQTKYIVSAGGSTFYNALPGTMKHTILKHKQKNKDLKIGAIGVSIGPFENSVQEKSLIEYLKNMDFLSVRDRSSYEYAKSLDLPFAAIDSFDLAALLPNIYNDVSFHNKNNDGKKVIGISVCNYESYIKGGNLDNENRRNTFIENLLNQVNNAGDYRFRFYIFNGNNKLGDRKITMELISSIVSLKDYEIVEYSRNTKDIWNSISSCDVMISTRLHAGIFACFAEVPFFLVEYHKKCTDFLIDVGQRPEYRLLDAEVDYKDAASQILSILNDENYHKPLNMREMIQKSLLNFTAIRI